MTNVLNFDEVQFIGCLLLLRTYIFYQRLSIFDPVARLSWACTNWLVVPLSQVFRPTQRWEPASIAGAYIMALVVALVMREVHGLPVDLIMVPLCAVFVAIRWLLELVLWAQCFAYKRAKMLKRGIEKGKYPKAKYALVLSVLSALVGVSVIVLFALQIL